ncbi:Fatty acid hydroxylase domain-containing protein 2 [Portunus trituberculatus]|uniref:Fatty acid hydroxylase domain-containing protein 2 n=1 Tax=Portunus trituberculatus TaxID=210409 RepID=A0A5B7E321_PORTR|nr:Fatty acid hydroxylase domain-containing protein 2 [Portunus trituberculatus]
MLYKHFHKMHHEWQSPISITAIYAHPLEHALSNMMPVFLGPLLMGSHVATIWLWVSLALLSTLNAHSGYHLPFFPSPEAHDFHHLNSGPGLILQVLLQWISKFSTNVQGVKQAMHFSPGLLVIVRAKQTSHHNPHHSPVMMCCESAENATSHTHRWLLSFNSVIWEKSAVFQIRAVWSAEVVTIMLPEEESR